MSLVLYTQVSQLRLNWNPAIKYSCHSSKVKKRWHYEFIIIFMICIINAAMNYLFSFWMSKIFQFCKIKNSFTWCKYVYSQKKLQQCLKAYFHVDSGKTVNCLRTSYILYSFVNNKSVNLWDSFWKYSVHSNNPDKVTKDINFWYKYFTFFNEQLTIYYELPCLVISILFFSSPVVYLTNFDWTSQAK